MTLVIPTAAPTGTQAATPDEGGGDQAALRVRDLVAGFGGAPVLRGVDLDVAAGSTTAVLGPSGCGKTTLLRAVAGFVAPTVGTVTIHGEPVAAGGSHHGWVPPERRSVGYVAQEGALFPHLCVADNVAFGLSRAARRDRRGTRARVTALLELVSLDAALADRRPQELSGGQQQRVALARALARGPRLVLLDEPFSALDASLRTATREAVREALVAVGVTVVLVTHDQDEALSFADRVALMRDGRIIQADTPAVAYEQPVDRGAAEFLGEAVVLAGGVSNGVASCALGTLPVQDGAPEGPAEIVLRPEQLRLTVTSPPSGRGRGADAGAPPSPAAHGVVERMTYFGHDTLTDIRLATGDLVRARSFGTDPLHRGDAVRITVLGPARAYPHPGAPTGDGAPRG
jgi:iron(III) transport system ATP-binding protein